MVGYFRIYSVWPHCLLMTSQVNEEAIQRYLHENQFFGVPRHYVHFLCQSSLPLLDENRNPLVEHGILQSGPDGNGRVFATLKESGLLQTLQKEGVEAISFQPIDNPLMDPFLPSLFHPVLQEKKEASILVIERQSAEEKTGIMLLREGKIHVIEYSEAPQSIKEAKLEDGSLFFRWANISVLCLSPSTVDHIASLPLPLHYAKKVRNNRTIYKQEYFLFDLFPALRSFSLVPIERSRWFSPIKAQVGEDSLERASEAFQRVQEEQAKKAKTLFSFENRSGADIDPALLYGY